MRRTLTLLVLVPFVLGLLVQPEKVAAQTGEPLPPVGTCAGSQSIGEYRLAANYFLGDSGCVITFSPSVDIEITHWAAASFVQEGQTLAWSVLAETSLSDLNRAVPPSFTSIDYIYQPSPPIFVRAGTQLQLKLRPDVSQEGWQLGDVRSWSGEIVLYWQGATHTPTPTSNVTPTPSRTVTPVPTLTPGCTSVPVTGNGANDITATFPLQADGYVLWSSGSGSINDGVGILHSENGGATYTYITAVSSGSRQTGLIGPTLLGFTLGQQTGTVIVQVCQGVSVEPTSVPTVAPEGGCVPVVVAGNGINQITATYDAGVGLVLIRWLASSGTVNDGVGIFLNSAYQRAINSGSRETILGGNVIGFSLGQQTGSAQVEVCPVPATATPTATPRLANTFIPSNVTTSTPTTTPTASATATATSTPTVTNTPPVAGACALSTTYNVPVAPGVITITLTIGVRFVVADNPIKINYGANAIDINPGSYEWQQASAEYVLYSLTGPARFLLCVADQASATPADPTLLPTNDPTTGDCYPATPIPTSLAASMPDLGLLLPTWTPTMVVSLTASVTATGVVSLTVIVDVIGTASTGIISPAAQLQTAVAPYSYASGQATAASWTSVIAPALDWLAIVNPNNPVWEVEGGPLWALAPLIKPLLPIIVISVLVALAGFLLWLGKLLLSLLDLLFKIIELIPGE